MDNTSGVALELKTGVPTYQVEDGLPRRRREEGRTHLLIHLAIEEENEDRWWGARTKRKINHGKELCLFVDESEPWSARLNPAQQGSRSFPCQSSHKTSGNRVLERSILAA
ncbi:MAG: hypothetical protein WAK31_14865 [Chthoniobacterales bacterium]